jgi:hypothetical protein
VGPDSFDGFTTGTEIRSRLRDEQEGQITQDSAVEGTGDAAGGGAMWFGRASAARPVANEPTPRITRRAAASMPHKSLVSRPAASPSESETAPAIGRTYR